MANKCPKTLGNKGLSGISAIWGNASATLLQHIGIKLQKKIVTDETLKTTEQTKNNISSFLFAIMIQQVKKEDDIYARNKDYPACQAV